MIPLPVVSFYGKEVKTVDKSIQEQARDIEARFRIQSRSLVDSLNDITINSDPQNAAHIAVLSTSKHACKHLMKTIDQFVSELDPSYDLVLQLVSFGKSLTIAVTEIWSLWPNLIRFDGFVDGAPVSLVQHVSQLSFLLLPQEKDAD